MRADQAPRASVRATTACAPGFTNERSSLPSSTTWRSTRYNGDDATGGRRDVGHLGISTVDDHGDGDGDLITTHQ
jgi:hypothetical protein